MAVPRPIEYDNQYDDYEELLFKCRVDRIDKLLCLWWLRIDKVVEGRLENMTPQEELFASFFRDEKITVKDMNVLELRAHREELAKIAFEARARLTAVDDEEKERRAKAKKESGPTGFSTSLQTDELTSNAINKIQDRQKKLTKAEKTLAGLIKMGIDPKDAEKLMSAGTILARVRQSEAKHGVTTPEPATNFNNPFAPRPKDDEPEEKVEVTIVEETATVIVTKTEEVKSEEKPKTGFINPFAK